MKKFIAILLCLCTFTAFSACSLNETLSGGGSSAVSDTDDAVEEIEEVYVVYEAFFLDNEEILDIFSELRGDQPPYENVTEDFHVTTRFMPNEDAHQLYGETVEIHIIGYKCGEVEADDGSMTANEGLCVTVSSDNEELQRHIDTLDNNWHITGAYKDGAKYTGYIDFSDAQPIDYTVTGTFGGYLSDGTICFDSAASQE